MVRRGHEGWGEEVLLCWQRLLLAHSIWFAQTGHRQELRIEPQAPDGRCIQRTLQRNYPTHVMTGCEDIGMKPSLREVLATSHIAAVSIALLLIWGIESVFQGLAAPFFWLAGYIWTAIAILGIPYWEWSDNRMMLFVTFPYLLGALFSLSAAWLLARWVYSDGPFRSLRKCAGSLAGGNHV